MHPAITVRLRAVSWRPPKRNCALAQPGFALSIFGVVRLAVQPYGPSERTGYSGEGEEKLSRTPLDNLDLTRLTW